MNSVAPLTYGHFRVVMDHEGQPLELGRGAMGVTYKAYDERLQIHVALKVIASTQIEKRLAESLFLREARAAARVRQTNVASVVYLNDVPGNFYYAMEFIEGESLQSWLRSHPKVSPLTAVRIGLQIARGLEAIHDQQIVHRDLKPGNIMIVRKSASTFELAAADADNWNIKIIDFGLARGILPTHATDSPANVTTGFLGTALYASPEQCEERTDLDGRSDLYSLGCILWEMLCGAPPFRAPTQREIINKHIAEIPSLDRVANLPDGLVAVLVRLLQKDRDDRFPNAASTVSALEAAQLPLESGDASTCQTGGTSLFLSPAKARPGKWRHSKWLAAAAALLVATGAIAWLVLAKQPAGPAPMLSTGKTQLASAARPEATRKSVAVLPFANLTGDKENEYLADGIHDDLLSSLAKIRELRIISRTSVMGYRDKPVNVREIAAELGVDVVVEGTVRRAGDQVRVVAQLIDAKSDEHLWADNFDGETTDVFALQSSIAKKIARLLVANLSPQAEHALTERPTVNSLAYEYYLKGKEAERRFIVTGSNDRTLGMKEIDESIGWFEKAVAEDPQFALAYSRLAAQHSTAYWYGRDRSAERAQKIRDAATRATQAGPDLPDGHLALSDYLATVEGDHEAALGELMRAKALSPSDPEIFSRAASQMRLLGRWDEALAALKTALTLAPRERRYYSNLATTLELLRRWPEAENVSRQGATLFPQSIVFPFAIAEEQWQRTGDLKQYCDAMEAIFPRIPDINKAFFFERTGQFEAALKQWNDLEGDSAPMSGTNSIPKTFYLGWNYVALGRRAEAEAAFKNSAEVLGKHLLNDPDNSLERAFLAVTYAGLGRRDDALREAARGMELAPEKSDVVSSRHVQMMAAWAYAQVGETEKAIDLLDYLLGVPGFAPDRASLPYRAAWFPLHGDPRFEKLLRQR